MHEHTGPDLSSLFGTDFASTEQRIDAAFNNPRVTEYFDEVRTAAGSDRPLAYGQFRAFLAASHLLFPVDAIKVYHMLEEMEQNSDQA